METLADKYLTFNDESKKLLNPNVVELLVDTFNKVYPAICDFFNGGEIRNVVFEADPNFDSPPALIIKDIKVTTTITDDDGSVIDEWEEKKIENNTVKFNPNDIICQEGTRDIDWITHELVHVAQDYQYGNGADYPHWIVEGLADYGREKFGLYNEKCGWKIYKAIWNKRTYETGYKTTAGFFIWIEKNFYATLAKELNSIIKSGKYTDEFFVEKTGKSVGELWQIYVDENRAYAITWLEEHIGETLPKDIRDKLKSGELDDELDKYLLEKTGRVIDDILEIYIIG